MSEKIILRADSLEKAVEIFLDLQKRYPTKGIEVYLYGSDHN